MSSRQLDERNEERRREWVAKTMGVTAEQYDELDVSIEEVVGNEGAFYGYRAELGPEADPLLIEKLFDGSRSIHLGFVDDDEDEPDHGG